MLNIVVRGSEVHQFVNYMAGMSVYVGSQILLSRKHNMSGYSAVAIQQIHMTTGLLLLIMLLYICFCTCVYVYTNLIVDLFYT